MDTPPEEENPAIESVGMEDSLFPFISDGYNHFLKLHSFSPTSKNSLSTDQQSDLEADSMPESQMELTEVGTKSFLLRCSCLQQCILL